jgi:hypothetical protein
MRWPPRFRRRQPAAPPTTPPAEATDDNAGQRQVVLALGPAIRPDCLRPMLPASVAVTAADTAPDCVIVEGADTRVVRDARARYPGAALLVAIREELDPGTVVNLLGAGADTCVELLNLRLVAAHVQALLRRRTADGAGP